MSISSEITRITNKRDASFAKVALKGVIVPSGSTIDDLPDLIDSISIDPTYSITKNLTSVTSSCDDTKVIQGNSFFTELTPASGYVISSITVTMGGVDITDQVFKAGTGAKAITANGTYDAEDDDFSGYDSVVVNVPNSYTASDEGKVVSSGALVSQTSDTVTQNGTVDTTLINSLTVNVSGGVTPTGTKQISITQNGTTTEDVTNYANAEITVNVSGGTSYLHPIGQNFFDANVYLTAGDGHVKIQARKALSSFFVGLRYLGTGTGVVNSLGTWFTITTGDAVVLNYTNVSNTGNATWNANFRKASASTSSSYGIGDGTHLSGETVSKTATATENIGTLFVYIGSMSSGSVLEFDVSMTLNGNRYF